MEGGEEFALFDLVKLKSCPVENRVLSFIITKIFVYKHCFCYLNVQNVKQKTSLLFGTIAPSVAADHEWGISSFFVLEFTFYNYRIRRTVKS